MLRDAARFATQSGAPQQALTHYREAMVASGITPRSRRITILLRG